MKKPLIGLAVACGIQLTGLPGCGSRSADAPNPPAVSTAASIDTSDPQAHEPERQELQIPPRSTLRMRLPGDFMQRWRALDTVGGGMQDRLIERLMGDPAVHRDLDGARDRSLATLRDLIEAQWDEAAARHAEQHDERYDELRKSVAAERPALSSLIDALIPSAHAEPVITKTVVDDLMISRGTETTTADTPTATITKTFSVETIFDQRSNRMLTSMTETKSSEVVEKATGRKYTLVSRISTEVGLDNCSDPDGKIHGTAKVVVFAQTTVNTGTQIAAATQNSTLDLAIVATYDDSAAMQSVEVTGRASETVTGIERGLMMGLLTATDTRGLTDGSRSIDVAFPEGQAPIPESSLELGEITFSNPVDLAVPIDAERLATFAVTATQGALLTNFSNGLQTSIHDMRNYSCVDVSLAAPKNVLQPNEAVDVTAVAVSMLDLSKHSSNLAGSGDAAVTPAAQLGEPEATFNVVAPARGKAQILVKSTSRRGIGLGLLTIPVQSRKSPKPVAAKSCDLPWTGTIRAVRTTRSQSSGKPDGRLLSDERSELTTMRTTAKLLGTRDTSGGIMNNYRASITVDYDSRNTQASHYAAGKMGCNPGIITSDERRTQLDRTTGQRTEAGLVAITANAGGGFFSFSSPELTGERRIEMTYQTACPSYDAVNTKSSPPEPRDIGSELFELEFPASTEMADTHQGTLIVKDSEDTETTYTWDINRDCLGQ